MGKYAKLLDRVLYSGKTTGFKFNAVCKLLLLLGFHQRIKGGHHIFTRPGVYEIINLQPKSGQVKVYQLEQVRDIITRYGLELNDDKQV
ncbi:MAG: type II toxin-antitoxin system HicA family toxin [Gammaproteobacteria bacterium]|nr:type II toxin-antitoxin system HicA family toxin [Gammaproteobacteria bacterium]